MIFDASIWMIVLAVVVYMAVGALWYSPVLFAGPWMAALGKKKEDMAGGNGAMYLVPAAGAVIVTVALAYLGHAMDLSGWIVGAILGFKAWFAFVATTTLTNRVFQGSPLKLYVIDMGYHLVGFVLAGAIVLA